MTVLRDFAKVHRFRGTADIDVSAAVYTGWVTLLTIRATEGQILEELEVELDLAKATTGFAAVNTSETIQATLATAPDGTNFRSHINDATAALTGTNAAGGGLKLRARHVDDVGVAVQVKLSAETGGDCEIPYVLTYRGRPDAVITPVAAA